MGEGNMFKAALFTKFMLEKSIFKLSFDDGLCINNKMYNYVASLNN